MPELPSTNPAQPAGGDDLKSQLAIKLISAMLSQAQNPITGASPKLEANPTGGFYERKPSSQPLLRLFGATQKVPIKGNNYYPVLKSLLGDVQLPTNVPAEPSGEPFVSEELFKSMVSPELSAARLVSGGGKNTPRPFALQEKGRLKNGKPVSYDPTDGEYKLPDGSVYDPAKHGEIGKTVEGLPSPEERAEIEKLFDSKKQLARVGQLFDPKFTGPAESRLGSFAQFTGVDVQDLKAKFPDDVKFRTAYQGVVNDYIKAITGAQMSEVEAKRIMKALPNIGASDEAFLPALKEIQRVVDEKLNTRFDVLEGLGIRGIGELRKQAEKMGRATLGDMTGGNTSGNTAPPAAGGLQVGGTIPGTNIRIKSIKLKAK